MIGFTFVIPHVQKGKKKDKMKKNTIHLYSIISYVFTSWSQIIMYIEIMCIILFHHFISYVRGANSLQFFQDSFGATLVYILYIYVCFSDCTFLKKEEKKKKKKGY